MAVLSIQSAVAYGSVGNAAAVFPLQRLGFEVWRVDTVLFSNHTGYGAWRGKVLEPELVADVIRGIEERGVFPRCAAVLSGYLGTSALGEVVLDGVRRVKTVNPGAIYCCDPVLGDAGRGLFVRPELERFFREQALALADIMTPNGFELATLAEMPVTTMQAAEAAVARLLKRGPKLVLATSLEIEGITETEAAMLAATEDGGYLVRTPRLDMVANGAGDLTAALFLGHYLRHRDSALALTETAAGVHAVLSETRRRGSPELTIVAAQEALLAPPRRFAVERVF
jgi:pyridoxine kinase